MIYYALLSTNGEVAQLVEHHVRNVGVESSNLFFSTNRRKANEAAIVSNRERAAVFLLQDTVLKRQCPVANSGGFGRVRYHDKRE